MRHLRYFVAVAEELHFGRAARRLRMSQPPLSQQIAALEGELGVKLFERGRRTALTHAGQMMLPEARATLEQAERAARRAQRADRGEIGSLSVGFVRSATYRALPVSLRAFRERAPDVELSLHSLSTLGQIDAFEEGRIDVGFLFRLPEQPMSDWLSLRTVSREPLVAGLPQGHPSAQKEKVPLGDLSLDRLLLWARSAGAGTFDRIVALCREAGFSPENVQELSHWQTIAQLVAAGGGRLAADRRSPSSEELRGRLPGRGRPGSKLGARCCAQERRTLAGGRSLPRRGRGGGREPESLKLLGPH